MIPGEVIKSGVRSQDQLSLHLRLLHSPVIADRLPLEEAGTAHRRVEQAEVQGKLVLTPNP